MKQQESQPPKSSRLLDLFKKAWPALIWLLIWAYVARGLNNDLLLVSPARVFSRMIQLFCGVERFWQTLGNSASNLMWAYGASLLLALALILVTRKSQSLRAFFDTPLILMKATPVASITILLLLYLPSSRLSTAVAIMLALPILFAGFDGLLTQEDLHLKELCSVFNLSKRRYFLRVFLPQILDALLPLAKTALSLTIKSGIAAEVITAPEATVGGALYRAKILLNTEDLFAWTAWVILLAYLSECVLKLLIRGTAYLLRHLSYRPNALRQKVFAFRKYQSLTRSRAQVPADRESQTQVDRATDVLSDQNENERLSPILTLRGAALSLGGKKIFEQLNLSLKENDCLILRGRSGQGKTSLLYVLAGLFELDEGFLCWSFDPVKQDEQKAFLPWLKKGKSKRSRQMLSMVFQEDRLLPFASAVQNCELFVDPEQSEEDIRQLLKDLGLSEDDLDRPVKEFSGGMARRVALARALLHPSKLLLLDECTKGLDPETERKVLAVVQKRRQGKITVVSAHEQTQEAACLGGSILEL